MARRQSQLRGYSTGGRCDPAGAAEGRYGLQLIARRDRPLTSLRCPGMSSTEIRLRELQGPAIAGVASAYRPLLIQSKLYSEEEVVKMVEVRTEPQATFSELSISASQGVGREIQDPSFNGYIEWRYVTAVRKDTPWVPRVGVSPPVTSFSYGWSRKSQ